MAIAARRRAVTPAALARAVAAIGTSPAVRAGDTAVLTGATGVYAGVRMPAAPDEVRVALAAAWADRGAVVGTTTGHDGLWAHRGDAKAALRRGLGTPLCAWTPAEAAGSRRPGAAGKRWLAAHAPGEGA